MENVVTCVSPGISYNVWMFQRTERITDKVDIQEEILNEAFKTNERVVVQYSKPIYTDETLERLDHFAGIHGENLQIRFYGHHEHDFSCQVLKKLPSVRNLAVDCLRAVKDQEILGELVYLEELSLGTYDSVWRNLLHVPGLARLRRLTLGESKTKKLDLIPLPQWENLESLHLDGFTTGIECLGSCPVLRELSLAGIGKRVGLEFVQQIGPLKSLRVILGGRTDIADARHSGLTHLEIGRVLGFNRFHPADFPSLTELTVSDQIRLDEICFGDESARLASLTMRTCKGLKRLSGLRNLKSLTELRISRTLVNLDMLIEEGLPPALEVFSFYPGDPNTQARLSALGYRQFR